MTSTAPRTRVLIDIEKGRVRPQVVLPKRKETTMNYRDFNPDYSCLPAEAYPYLALALGSPKPTRLTLWGRITAALRRLSILPAAIFLPLADPPAEHLSTLPDQNSLVWAVDKRGQERPDLLPLIVEGNPYSL